MDEKVKKEANTIKAKRLYLFRFYFEKTYITKSVRVVMCPALFWDFRV